MTNWIDAKYVNLAGVRLNKFKRLNDGLYMFRCPYCGDSQKNENKARGYFYPTKSARMAFKCHNCGIQTTFGRFLKDQFDDLYRDYLFEVFKEKEETESKAEKLVEKAKEEVDVKPILGHLWPISKLPPDHPAYEYLQKRKIFYMFYDRLYYVADAKKFVSTIPRYQNRLEKWKDGEEAIVIPYTNPDGLGYLQLRFLDKNHPMRYMTLEIKGGDKVWGLPYLCHSGPVFVFEGPFDAMMAPNGVAVACADLTSAVALLEELGHKDIRLVPDADWHRNYDIYRRMQSYIKNGYTVVFLDENELGGKDLNEAVVSGKWSQADLGRYLEKKTCYGRLDAELEFAKYKKPPKNPNKPQQMPKQNGGKSKKPEFKW